jgi:hypothetical protein
MTVKREFVAIIITIIIIIIIIVMADGTQEMIVLVT